MLLWSDSSVSNCWTSHVPFGRMISVFLTGEQMDSAPSHLYYFLGCDKSVPQAMGTKRDLLQPPTPGPPVSSSGQHLLPRQLECSVPKDTWRKAGGERCCKSGACRPSGETLAGFSYLCGQNLLSDSGTKTVRKGSRVGLDVHDEI